MVLTADTDIVATVSNTANVFSVPSILTLGVNSEPKSAANCFSMLNAVTTVVLAVTSAVSCTILLTTMSVLTSTSTEISAVCVLSLLTCCANCEEISTWLVLVLSFTAETTKSASNCADWFLVLKLSAVCWNCASALTT